MHPGFFITLGHRLTTVLTYAIPEGLGCSVRKIIG